MRIYVPGTFDIPHLGHINLFRKAKELGTVIVSVNTDEFTSRYKRPPVMDLETRMEILREFRCVDEVIVNEGNEDSTISILKSQATHILHGDDWTGESLMKQMGLTQEWLDEHGIELIYVPYTPNISTSEIINKCNEIKRNNNLLTP